jgi:hypothetical protein
VTPAAQRGDQRRGDEEQHRRDEQQRDDELDLRRRACCPVAELTRPPRAGVGGDRRQ